LDDGVKDFVDRDKDIGSGMDVDKEGASKVGHGLLDGLGN